MTRARLLEREFRYRIVVSLAIVFAACLTAYLVFRGRETLPEALLGIPWARSAGFLGAAIMCLGASALRMAAGTVLHSRTIMSFAVRTEDLATAPPYNLVRNPIYLSDLVAATAFALCMPPGGLVYPLLLTLHYRNLIEYEEGRLDERFSASFGRYCASVPRLVPTLRSSAAFVRSVGRIKFDRDGMRFNATYALFIPGLVLAAFTGEFFHAVLIGLPGVADWAYWHTVKGLADSPSPEAGR